MRRERAITSPVSALLLLILGSEGELSAPQIAARLRIDVKAVHAYLAYFVSRGLVARSSYTFALTPRGEAYVKKHERHLQEVARSHHQSLKLSKLISTYLKKSKVIVEEVKRLYDLSGCEDVVVFLVEFRLRTGRKYWWPARGSHVEELAERLGVSSSVIGECLRRLESQGVIFMVYDGRRGVVKIRLGRQLDPLFEAL